MSSQDAPQSWLEKERWFLYELVEQEEMKCSEEHKQLYRAKSPFRFYRRTDMDGRPCRVYGIAGKDPNTNEWRYSCVTTMLFFLNDTVGGVPVSVLEEIDEWTDDDYHWINVLPEHAKPIMTERTGWMEMLP